MNKRETILNTTLEILKSSGKTPKVTPSEQKKWLDEIQAEKSLCIAGLGHEGLEKICTKVNAEIKSYGGHLSPDNYGTAFLSIKESEDYFMFDNQEINEKDFTKFLCECYLENLEEDLFEEDDLMAEGTNLDARDMFKKFKVKYKEEMSEIKKNLKAGEYAKSKKGCEELIKILKDVKKEISSLDSTAGSVVFGFFTAWTLSFLRSLLLCLIPGIGATAASIINLIEEWSKPVKKLIDGDSVELDDFNAYKNTIESRLSSMEKVIENLIKKIDRLEKEEKELNKELKKESTDIMIDNIFMCCEDSNTGEILRIKTFDQLINEYCIDDEDIMIEGTNLDARDLFKKFKVEYKEEMSKIKKNLKDGKYAESKKGCQELIKVLKKVKKEISSLDSTAGSVVFGFFTAWTITFLRTLLLSLIPSLGTIAASIMMLIEQWSKPVKKLVGGDSVELDDFNAYKNTIESRLDSMEKVIENLIKKIDRLEKEEKELKKELKKESSEFDDIMGLKFVGENGELVDVRDIALEMYEALELEDDDEDEVTTEGANLESRRVYKQMKKQVKDLTKKYKKAMKNSNYAVAKAALNELKKVVFDAEKQIKATESTGVSLVFGAIFECILSITRSIYILIPIAGPFIAIFKNVKYMFDKIGKVYDNMKKSDNITADEFNDYKNYLLVHIGTLKETIKKLEKVVDEESKLVKKAEIDQAKSEKEIQESAEFKAEKLAIYSACSRGEITVEEREELYKELQDKYYLSEASTDSETILNETVLSNKEKFARVRSVLYERCSKGELTVEERENLVLKAKEMIFSESEDKEIAAETSKEDEKMSKEIDKELEKAVK